MSMDWPSPLLVLTRVAWARLATTSRLSSSCVENSRRRGELVLVGVRWAEGAGRSVPSSRLGFARARWGLSAAPWSSEAPGKGGECRGSPRGLCLVPMGREENQGVGKVLTLFGPSEVGLRLRCLRIRWGLCMSLVGDGSLGGGSPLAKDQRSCLGSAIREGSCVRLAYVIG
jgi:hypothetical protein